MCRGPKGGETRDGGEGVDSGAWASSEYLLLVGEGSCSQPQSLPVCNCRSVHRRCGGGVGWGAAPVELQVFMGAGTTGQDAGYQATLLGRGMLKMCVMKLSPARQK